MKARFNELKVPEGDYKKVLISLLKLYLFRLEDRPGNDEEENMIRHESDEPWDNLSEHQQQTLNCLSIYKCH